MDHGPRTTSQGFSAIEMIVVILIFTILLAIVLIPSYMRLQIKAQETQIRSNAVNLQKMVEVFRMGAFKYPGSLSEDLERDANERNYNMELSNPMTGAKGTVGSGRWAVKIDRDTNPENIPMPGFVAYKYIDPGHYEIYCYNRDGQLLKDAMGQDIYVIKTK